MSPRAASAAIVLLLCAIPAHSDIVERTPEWDRPGRVTEKTVFFGEGERDTAEERGEPSPRDKSYAWFWLEKGNNYLLAGLREKAAAAFAKAYAAGGTARIPAGFKRVEILESLGRIEEAIELLERMRQEDLVSNNDHAQAQVLRARLEDQRRKMAVKPAVPYDGRAWVLQTQVERLRYVMDAMQELRAHGVPLAMSMHQYAFHLDEYFLAHPAEPAADGADVLSRIVYENDPAARIPIDRWRIDPASTLVEETVKTDHPQFTGAQWMTLTQEQKIRYVQEAMEVLRQQNVPMARTPTAYVFAVDEMFTEDPELPAGDSVVTMASLLVRTEPEAREVLEALRLK
jgi:tetratricopeptide (TPR) repeat protein